MFRWVTRVVDNTSSQEIVLARVQVAKRFRQRGHFKRLLIGLERIAVRHDATLVIEQANPNLSRILMGQGYIRCVSEGARPLPICSKISGTWKRVPDANQATALITLPVTILKQIDVSRLPSEIIPYLEDLVQSEAERFRMRLSKRLQDEILPAVLEANRRNC